VQEQEGVVHADRTLSAADDAGDDPALMLCFGMETDESLDREGRRAWSSD
jgi:hypothetical protein